MSKTLRAKLVAGVGVLSIVLGGVLVALPGIASAGHVQPVRNPGGLDNPTCGDFGFGTQAKDATQGDPGDTGTADSGGEPDLVVNWSFENDGTIDFEVAGNSDFLVAAAIVKQGAANSGGGANVYFYDPAVSSDTGLVDPKGDEQFSHIIFCAPGNGNTTTTSEDDETTTTAEETTTTAEETTTTVEETTTTVEETTTTAEETTTTTEETTTTVEETTTTAEETTTTAEETTTTDPEVLGESTTVPGESTTTDDPAVLGSQTTLPSTGNDTIELAGVGVALMIFGAILLGGSRRSLLTE